MKVIAEKFPYPGLRQGCAIESYVQCILNVTLYYPTLRLPILSLVIEKLLYLDVSTPTHTHSLSHSRTVTPSGSIHHVGTPVGSGQPRED